MSEVQLNAKYWTEPVFRDMVDDYREALNAGDYVKAKEIQLAMKEVSEDEAKRMQEELLDMSV